MPPVLRNLPFFPARTQARFGGRALDVYPYQIVVWVGVSPVGDESPPAPARRFPAVLDTGHSHNFAISPTLLRDWAGHEWNALPLEPVERRHQGVPVPLRRANVWLFPNQYGWRDLLDPGLPPVLLELDEGLAVYGDGVQVGSGATAGLVAPRLPVLGLRALATNRLRVRLEPLDRAVWVDQLSP